MFRQRPHGASVDLDSHLSVTDRCRSLVDELRGGQWVAEAMVSSLCESRMPQCTENRMQAWFEVCVPQHLTKIQRKPGSTLREGPHGAIVDLGSHLSVTDKCRSLVDKLRGGQWVAEAMLCSWYESRCPNEPKI